MNIIHVFILALVEGLTEFLPISSTGHLILTSKLLGLGDSEFLKTFEIVIQLGAILAVVYLYFNKIVNDRKLIKKLIVAFLPTAVVGLTLYPLIKGFLLGNSFVTLNALFWGGIALIFIENIIQKKSVSVDNLAKISYRQALLVGTFQSLSVVPGVSRAAATIIGGILSGFDRRVATEFSFLLAIPTMFAASALDIYKSKDILIASNITYILLGTVLSFLFAMFAVRFLLDYVKKNDFKAFGVYRIVLALVFWIFVK